MKSKSLAMTGSLTPWPRETAEAGVDTLATWEAVAGREDGDGARFVLPRTFLESVDLTAHRGHVGGEDGLRGACCLVPTNGKASGRSRKLTRWMRTGNSKRDCGGTANSVRAA